MFQSSRAARRWQDLHLTYSSLLRATADISQGKAIHEQMTQTGHDQNTFLANLLVQMYGKFGSVDLAWSSFEKIQDRNVFSWTIMLSVYSQNGYCVEALQLYHAMNLEGTPADAFVLSQVLGVCSLLGNAREGKKIHERVDACDQLQSDTVLQNALVNMYAKSGCLEGARSLFERTRRKDLVSWNVIMAAYSKHGKLVEALQLFEEMVTLIEPDPVSYVTAISACSVLQDVERGSALHLRIRTNNDCRTHVSVQNALVSFYGKCGCLDEARTVFEEMDVKTSVSWNALLAGYAQHGFGFQVLDLYRRMDQEGVEATKVTYVSVVSWCDDPRLLADLHGRITSTGYSSDVVVSTALVDAYARQRRLEKAQETFQLLESKNIHTWNSLIGAFIQNERTDRALQVFHNMELEGAQPNDITLLLVLGACNSSHRLVYGRKLHARVTASHLRSTALQNSLINMYSKCGSFEDARRVFEDMKTERVTSVVSWNAIIAACVLHSLDVEAVEIYDDMLRSGVEPDSFTYASILTACANLSDSERGRAVLEQLDNAKLKDEVVATAAIDMFGKCQELDRALSIFHTLVRKQEVRNLSAVPWNAMISACVQCGDVARAFEIFQRMDWEGVKPVAASFISTLAACTDVGLLSRGRELHSRLALQHHRLDEEIGTALVNMYSRCGSLETARRVFDKLEPAANNFATSWTAMLAAYSHHACGSEVLELLWLMSLAGVVANEINFTSILNACSHSGMRDEALSVFLDMQREYGVGASAEHFVCVSDMLARAGLLVDADDLISCSPFQPQPVAWKSLLNACRVQGNLPLAGRVACQVSELEPQLSAPYILLSSC